MTGPVAENFEHKADIGVRGKGRTLEEAFVGGALSMMGVMFDLKGVKASKTIDIRCDADDVEALFVEWLNAILSKRDLENMVFCQFEAKVGDMAGQNGKQLSGTAWGEHYDPKRHEAKIEVKAATYSQLNVQKDSSGQYIAQCIIDV